MITKSKLAVLMDDGWSVVDLKSGRSLAKGKCPEMVLGGVAVQISLSGCGRIPNLAFWTEARERQITLGHGWNKSLGNRPIPEGAAGMIHHPMQGCIHLFLTAKGWKPVGVLPYMPERGTSRELKFTTII